MLSSARIPKTFLVLTLFCVVLSALGLVFLPFLPWKETAVPGFRVPTKFSYLEYLEAELVHLKLGL